MHVGIEMLPFKSFGNGPHQPVVWHLYICVCACVRVFFKEFDFNMIVNSVGLMGYGCFAPLLR